MSASNYSWVCFDCRTTQRQPKPAKRVPLCTSCGRDCYCLGYKVEIPKKDDLRAWRLLRADCQEREFTALDERRLSRVRAFHEIEKRIRDLEALDQNPGRAKLIKDLRQQLADCR